MRLRTFDGGGDIHSFFKAPRRRYQRPLSTISWKLPLIISQSPFSRTMHSRWRLPKFPYSPIFLGEQGGGLRLFVLSWLHEWWVSCRRGSSLLSLRGVLESRSSGRIVERPHVFRPPKLPVAKATPPLQRDAKTTTLPFVYRGSAIFVSEKMGNLQEMAVSHRGNSRLNGK